MFLKWRKRHKEQDTAEASNRRRAGFTLVETMVSVLLLSILMAMVVGIVSPAFKVFIRMQKLQFAQMILDNVVEDVQDTVREATTYVKIYATNDITGTGASSGVALEYVNTDGFVTLLSTGGCDATYTYKGQNLDSTPSFDAVGAGQLLYRYYRIPDNNTTQYPNLYYNYAVKNSTNIPIARAATTAFGSGYYMGYKLQITFDFDGVTSGQVKHLKATASLYDDQDKDSVMDDGEEVVSDTFVIDLRYYVEREDKVTAQVDTADAMGFFTEQQ